MPPAKDSAELRRPVIRMALPIGKAPAEKKPGEKAAGAWTEPSPELLPMPNLDFSRTPVSAVYLDENDPRSIYKPKKAKSGKGRAIGASALIAAVLVGAVWYGKLWRHWPAGKKAEAAAQVKVEAGNAARGAVTAPEVVASAAETKEMKVPSPVAAPASTKEEHAAEIVKSGAGEPADAKVEGGMTLAVAPKRTAANRPEISAKRVAVREERLVGKKGLRAAIRPVEVARSAEAPSNAPAPPPKLLKAVPPVYPPEAMWKFITGDVKAEAVVEPNGRLGDVKVIFGPPALRAAAVEALRQYQYEPATQGGRAVAARITVTVKFWFNP